MSRSGSSLIHRWPASNQTSLLFLFVKLPFHFKPQSENVVAFTELFHPPTPARSFVPVIAVPQVVLK
ncbi:hypothetical protein Plhal703r1_c17g0078031 [Plasmopara halstedii]